MAGDRGGTITLTQDVDAAVQGVDFVYADTWVSMDAPESVWDERVEMLRPYRVTIEVLDPSNNPNLKFMHCLPALHNRSTEKGEEIFRKYGLEGLEVTDDVFESDYSVVFDQAENRLHAIKAVIVATLGH